MECPNCGRENRDIAQFCQFCGASLLSAEDASEPREEGMEDTVLAAADEGAGSTPQETAEWVPEPEPVEVPLEPPVDDEPAADLDVVPEVEEQEVAVVPAAAEADVVEDQTLAPVSVPSESKEEPEMVAVSEGAHRSEEEEAPSPVEEGGDEETTAELLAEEETKAVSASELLAKEEVEEAMAAEPLLEEETEEVLVPLEDVSEALEENYDALIEMADEGLLPWREESGALEPLVEGTIVADRYRVSEVLSVSDHEILYRVRDLRRCPQCGFEQNSPDQAFCTSCGAVRDQKPVATMLERASSLVDEPVEAEVEDHFVEERAYWVWRETAKTGPLGGSEEPVRMVLGHKSDTGQVRELDEDSLFVLTMSRTHESIEDSMALFIVADGMGGHEGGEIASRIAIQTLANVLLENIFCASMGGAVLSPEMIRDWMQRAVEIANDHVYLERQKRQNDMGTTVTAALLAGWSLYLAHVGDCRAYRWSESGLEQLTIDHSIVASMVASGAAQPEEVYTHPQRSVIYRCVGDQPSVEVDTAILTVNRGDRLILCCDGLWEMLRDEGIEDVLLRESDPQQAAEIMVEEANVAGGSDNISVIVVQL